MWNTSLCDSSPTDSKDGQTDMNNLHKIRSEDRKLERAGWTQMIELVPRRPTPRANCSSSPEIAPDEPGEEDFKPTVEL